MPKRKTPELDPKEQFKRFQETAKELAVEEKEDILGKTFKRLSKPSKNRQPSRKP